MITDEDIDRQWQKIHKLGLTRMNDDTYALAVTSPLPGSKSSSKTKNVDLFVSRKMTKEETFH
jgi:hypothetical protein